MIFFRGMIFMEIIIIIIIIIIIMCRDVIIEKPRTVSREVCDQTTDDSVQVPQVIK